MPLNRCGSVRARLSVWFRWRSAAWKASSVAVKDLQTARVVLRERGLSLKQVQRGAPLGAGFGQEQRAAREIEGGEIVLARELAAFGFQCSRPAIIR